MADHTAHHSIDTFLAGLPSLLSGWVWLAGSGPGDAGLLSAQVMVALTQADVVIYDALVGDDILCLVPNTTHLHYAGKRGGKPSAIQNDITEALIAYAREGKRVLRLKGGDSMLFGRGAEEATALSRAGIPFRILPGVTSGIAAPSYAGIPLTHRALSSSVSFITGHGANGDVPNMNWHALARGADVLVFFMAMKHAELIKNKLLDAGLAASRPCAVISNGTLADQQVFSGTLAEMHLLANQTAPPAIIVVGETIPLASELAWFAQAGESA